MRGASTPSRGVANISMLRKKLMARNIRKMGATIYIYIERFSLPMKLHLEQIFCIRMYPCKKAKYSNCPFESTE